MINILRVILFFIPLLIIQDINAQKRNLAGENLIANVNGRSTFSLDGKWNIIIDPMEVGYLDYRSKPKLPTSTFAGNAKPKRISDRIEYDFDTSPSINVPGDWNSQLKELEYYEGTIWYKRSFNYLKTKNKRQFLYFGAVNYEANVYLNGKKVGDHIGGFTPFNFEITDLLLDGENHLILRVNNERKKEAVPTLNFDWWNYGGITRSVDIIETPEVFVQDYFVQLAKGEKNTIKGWVKINGSTEQTVKVEIPEINYTGSFEVKDGIASIEFDIDVQLWTPESPKLYDVKISLGNDAVEDQIGFRTIETSGHDILLNGKSTFLRGVCLHEEAPFRTGRAHSKEDAKILLGWAKDLGCNFVRLAHYPHNENMVRMADQMGLMVWSEIPVYWTILWDNEETYRNAESQLLENISRDKNRASVILWSMANETPLSDARLKFISSLAKKSKETDPTRLVTAALEVHTYPDNPNTVVLEDPLAEYLDVYGCNEYFGWYSGLPERADDISWEIKYDKPLIISEFGGGSLQGYFGDKKERWTENYVEDVYAHNVDMFDRIPFLRGTTPWILKDFRSPKRVLPGIQDGWNRKGLISDQGIKKLPFYTMKDWYENIVIKYK